MQGIAALSLLFSLTSLLVAPSTSFQPVTQPRSLERPQSRSVVFSGRTVRSAASEQNNDSGKRAETTRNPLFEWLSTPRDRPPNSSSFFYNDEVASHLHGYMFLIGGLAARDETFFVSFLVLATAAAAAVLDGRLPANPRVPALVAAATLACTLSCRYVVGYEPSLLPGEVGYEGPADSALLWEVVVCALNVAWGVWGPWRGKEERMA